jgi:hypothetical protein
MTARDELIEDLATKVPKADWDMADEIGDLSGVADALHAAGWRKMPNRENVIRALAKEQLLDGYSATSVERLYGGHADAILALMDGGNE